MSDAFQRSLCLSVCLTLSCGGGVTLRYSTRMHVINTSVVTNVIRFIESLMRFTRPTLYHFFTGGLMKLTSVAGFNTDIVQMEKHKLKKIHANLKPEISGQRSFLLSVTFYTHFLHIYASYGGSVSYQTKALITAQHLCFFQPSLNLATELAPCITFTLTTIQNTLATTFTQANNFFFKNAF